MKRKPKHQFYIVTTLRWADHESEKIDEQHIFATMEEAVAYLQYIYDNYYNPKYEYTFHGIWLEPWRKSFAIEQPDWRLSGYIKIVCLEDSAKLLNSLIPNK